MNLEDLPKIIQNKISIESNGCWLWIGYCVPDGYGRLSRQINKKLVTYWAHRYGYILSKGSIPKGMVLDHNCRTRNCVNPGHLDPVPSTINGKMKSQEFRESTHIEITDAERSYLISVLNAHSSNWESRSLLNKLSYFEAHFECL